MKENGNRFDQIQKLIEEAEAKGESITMLVREQIALLQHAHDEFVKMALSRGYDISDFRVGHTEVAQYTAMKQLAAKIGDPTEEFDELIKSVMIRIFGEINYKRHFENGEP